MIELTYPMDEWKEVASLVAKYRALEIAIAALESVAGECRAAMEPLVDAHGNWKDAEGYARRVTTAESPKYDDEGLEALYASVPEAKELLEPHRSMRKGSTYVQIK